MLTLFLNVTALGQGYLPILKHFAGIDGISLDMCNSVDIKHFILCLILVQPRKHPNMTEKLLTGT